MVVRPRKRETKSEKNPGALTASNESALQRRCAEWFGYRYPKLLLFAIPNGGYRRKREAARLKAEGALSGVADLMLARPRRDRSGLWKHGLFIEMKSGEGRQSDSQKAFEDRATRAGYEYRICRTFEEFVAAVEAYVPRERGGEAEERKATKNEG